MVFSEKVIISRKVESRVSCWRALVPSYTLVLLFIFFIIALLMNGLFKPLTKGGFFCNDSSLNYPFNDETISLKVLLIICLLIPVVVIKVFDRVIKKQLKNRTHRSKSDRYRKKSFDAEESQECGELVESSEESVKRRRLKDATVTETDSEFEVVEKLLVNGGLDVSRRDSDVTIGQKQDFRINSSAIDQLHLFLFGLIATMLITGIGKVASGRPRPHFMQRCVPNIDCSAPANSNVFIEDYVCTNSQLGSIGIAYILTSWPSGHASIVFYSMLYMIIYLHNVIPAIVQLSSHKCKERFDPLILYILYVLMVGLALFVALTRVTDYHHHPIDVLSGSLIGTFISLAVSKQFL